MSSANDRISVVLPFRDAEDTITEQLEALAAQQTADVWELIAVDGGSRDASARIVQNFQTRLPNLVVLPAPGSRNAAAVRNAGVRMASGNRLLFCDADDVVGDRWLATMAQALELHDFVAGSLEWERLNATWLLRTRTLPQVAGLQERNPPFLPFAASANMAMARHVFDALGGFDEGFDTLEDTDFCFRAQLAGYELRFVPEAVVHSRLRGSPRAVFLQARDYGRGSVALQRRFRAHGMRQRNPLWGLAGWLGTLPRLLAVHDRAGLLRWLHRVGWKVGLLQGSIRHRLLVL
jgi:GT2 family glycosyltransferase